MEELSEIKFEEFMVMRISWFFKEAIISLKRNWVMSMAAISTVALSLLVLGLFAFVALTLDDLITSFERQVEIEVFLKDEAPFQEVQALQEKIISWKEVKNVKYVSKEEALRKFKEKYKDNPEMIEAIPGNPLPASFQISLKNPKNVVRVAKRLEGRKEIDEVKYGQQVVEKLFAVTKVVRMIGLLFILLLGFASLSLIVITIRLAIFARRNEVSIMRLVGASNWFIRLPFLLEGMGQGLIGAIIAIILIHFTRVTFFEKIAKSLSFLPISFGFDLFLKLSASLIVAGLCIGALGSSIALRRFLKV